MTRTTSASGRPRDSQFALKPEQVRKIVCACVSPRDRCLVRTLADTGCRRAEVAALDVRDVDFAAHRLTIHSGKRAKQRIVPITDALENELRLLVGRRDHGPVFLSNRHAALTPRQVNRIVERAGQLAEVSNPNPTSSGKVTCRLFRHTFAQHWKQRGGDIESLSRILGHATSATTVDLYGTQDIDDLQSSYERIMSATDG